MTSKEWLNGPLTFAVVSVSIVLAIIVVTTVTNILHLAIPVIRASGAVTIATSVVIALTTAVFAGRIIAAASTGRGWCTSSTGRSFSTATWTRVTSRTRIKAPGCWRWRTGPLQTRLANSCLAKVFGEYSYFNLQQVVTTNTLIVHLMIGIIRITTALILHERKAAPNQ